MKICFETLAGNGFDQPARPVDARAVNPLFARLEEQRPGGILFAGPGFEIPDDGAREVVSETGCVREKMADRHGFGCRSNRIRSGSAVKRVEHFQIGQLGKIFLRRIVQAEPALFNELHRRHCGDRFRHRRDPEDRINRQRPATRDVRNPEGSLIQDAAAVGGDRNDAGNIAAPDGV